VKKLIPSRKPRGDTTTTMTMKAHHYINNNQPTMIGCGQVMQVEVKKIAGEGGERNEAEVLLAHCEGCGKRR
jgi:hypothetical protein